jgi:hypothetical protein
MSKFLKAFFGTEKELEAPPPPVAAAPATEPPKLQPAQSSYPWLKLLIQPADARVAVILEIDSALAYPYWLGLLDVRDDIDQFWVETAYQCIKLDAQAAIAGTEFDPRIVGKSSEIRFSRAPEWAISGFPIGRGMDLATKGKEARRHYVRIRGRMPF